MWLLRMYRTVSCDAAAPRTMADAPHRARVGLQPVRRPRRPEARPLVDLSDFQSAELSDFRPALHQVLEQTGSFARPSANWRSEERRVGKECRFRVVVYAEK